MRMRNLFSMRDWQTAQRSQLKHDDEAVHLAARWAGKEAFLKARCAAISRHANMCRSRISVHARQLPMGAHRNSRRFPRRAARHTASFEVQRKVQQSLGLPLDPVRQSYDISISISHDGPIASAVVMLKSEMPFPLAKVGGTRNNSSSRFVGFGRSGNTRM